MDNNHEFVLTDEHKKLRDKKKSPEAGLKETANNSLPARSCEWKDEITGKPNTPVLCPNHVDTKNKSKYRLSAPITAAGLEFLCDVLFQAGFGDEVISLLRGYGVNTAADLLPSDYTGFHNVLVGIVAGRIKKLPYYGGNRHV